MDRNKAAVLLLLPVVFGASARNSADSAGLWRTFVSPAAFYRVEYPSGWAVQQEDDVVNIVPPDGRGAVTISAYHASKGPGDLARLIRQTFTEERPTSPMVAVSRSNWSGYEQTFHDDKKRVDWIADVAYRSPVLVLITVNDEHLAGRESVYRRIVDSLRLLDVAPAKKPLQTDGRERERSDRRARR